MKKTYDFIVIGAGIMGLTIAYELKVKYPEARIAILEKEQQQALHASGRNSGVLHAGIYYGADSQKAKFCLNGNRLMKSFCHEHGLKLNDCGKLIIAKNEAEFIALKKLYQLGLNNGANLAFISSKEAREIEPRINGYSHAIWSPETSSVCPIEVTNALAVMLKKQGVDFHFNSEVVSINLQTQQLRSRTQYTFKFAYLFNCAGLYADVVAKQCEQTVHRYQIVPFKGLYLVTKEQQSFHLHTNVYPVPDLKYPFLGVHFTITASGKTKVGPTAIPVFWREHYQGFNRFKLNEAMAISSWYLKSIACDHFNFRQLVWKEFKFLFKKKLIKEANLLLNKSITNNKFFYLKPGIRAQLYDKEEKKLVNDFTFINTDKACHVLNAVSPGFTSSFAIAKYLIKEVAHV